MFVCLFSISVMLLTILFLISHYVYVSKHCVRKCMFVCLYVPELILIVRVSISLCVYLQFSKKGLYLYLYGICIAKKKSISLCVNVYFVYLI